MTASHHTLSMAPLMGLCLLTAFPCGSLNAAAQEKPNVILIITDDQGYGDIGAHGNPLIQTPNMDQLHAESVRFTNFHVDPTCSPTRIEISVRQPPAPRLTHALASERQQNRG